MTLDNISTIASLVTPVITVAGFMLLKFNDFKHLEKDVREIKKDIHFIKEDTIKNSTDIAVLREKTKEL